MAGAAADNFSVKAVLELLAGQTVVLGAAVAEECLEGAEDWDVKR